MRKHSTKSLRELLKEHKESLQEYDRITHILGISEIETAETSFEEKAHVKKELVERSKEILQTIRDALEKKITQDYANFLLVASINGLHSAKTKEELEKEKDLLNNSIRSNLERHLRNRTVNVLFHPRSPQQPKPKPKVAQEHKARRFHKRH